MKILMVCLGNICRSPLAQGILEHKVAEAGLSWQVDSAGTSSWHIGQAPDPRSVAIGKKHGIDISRQRGRQVSPTDLEDYDLILPMDQANYQSLRQIFGEKFESHKINMILNYVYPGRNMPVPDPYYDDSFERVYGLLDQACENIIDHFGSSQ